MKTRSFPSLCFFGQLSLALNGFFLLLLLLLFLTSKLWLPAIGHWLIQTSPPVPAEAIVVLAGGGPERLMPGIEFYKQGLAPELWYTGNVPSPELRSFNDATFAQRFALEQGVPATRTHLLKTDSTWEDAEQITTFAKQRNMKKLLILSSWYHSRRSACILHRHLDKEGIQFTFIAVPTRSYSPDNWWRNEQGLVATFNEFVKMGFYWHTYGLNPWSCGQ